MQWCMYVCMRYNKQWLSQIHPFPPSPTHLPGRCRYCWRSCRGKLGEPGRLVEPHWIAPSTGTWPGRWRGSLGRRTCRQGPTDPSVVCVAMLIEMSAWLMQWSTWVNDWCSDRDEWMIDAVIEMSEWLNSMTSYFISALPHHITAQHSTAYHSTSYHIII